MSARTSRSSRALSAPVRIEMRLDVFLAQGRFTSRTRAARAIETGRVTVNGKPARPSTEVRGDEEICVIGEDVFVSEGGYKLEKALSEFHADISGKVFADLGASTGGFTDCLLRRGASRVFAVDVGTAQLDSRLSADARVEVMDGVNARYLTPEDFPCALDGVTADLSFISLSLVLPAVARLLAHGREAYVLVKPQFECGRNGQNKRGIVTDAKVRERAVEEVCRQAENCGFSVVGLSRAPLREKKNVEYVLRLVRGEAGHADIASLLADAGGA